MRNTTARLALPLFLAGASLLFDPVSASEVRDTAKMFSPAAVRQAESELNRIEKVTKVPVLIETIEVMPNAPEGKDTKTRAFNTLAESRFGESGVQGVYILLSKEDKLISNTLIRARLASRLPESSRERIRAAFIDEFKAGKFDGGLERGVKSIETSLGDRPAVTPGLPGPRPRVGNAPPVNAPRANGGGFGMSTILLIGLGIFGVFLVLRLLGGLMGAGRSGGGGMGRPGYGPGQGAAGYGGGGYGGGGGGGGFFSSMFGGIGGALAGNWLYDQFRGGNHGAGQQSDSTGGMFGGSEPTSYDPGGDQITGGSDNSGQAGSWDAPDTGGGGGDWGGGGGDWGGGGGGDGGGGGGDW